MYTDSGMLSSCLLKELSEYLKMQKKIHCGGKTRKKGKIVEYLLSTLPDTPVEKGKFEISDLEDGTAAIQ